jgi:hypothetical protein
LRVPLFPGGMAETPCRPGGDKHVMKTNSY